jgi:Protein of unknown function (DUF4239)
MSWIGSLPSWALFPLFGAAALLFMVAVDGVMRRRVIPTSVRERAGPTASTTLQALATIYAVLVAFVIVNEYNSLRDAQSIISDRVAALNIVYENARNLDPPKGLQIQAATLAYARTDLATGIPFVERTGRPSPAADRALQRIYTVMASFDPAATGDQAAYRVILDALAQIAQTRSRLAGAAKATIPTSLFTILALLAAATLTVATTMDTRHRRSHLIILSTLALALATTLGLVAAFDYPFHGFIHADTTALDQFVHLPSAR